MSLTFQSAFIPLVYVPSASRGPPTPWANEDLLPVGLSSAARDDEAKKKKRRARYRCRSGHGHQDAVGNR